MRALAARNMDPSLTALVSQLNAAMIEEVKKKGHLTDPVLAAAFGRVPRHLFVPLLYTQGKAGLERHLVDRDEPERALLEMIYVDAPLAIAVSGNEVESTTSQPTVMAMMIEAARLGNGHGVLEVGTGSGYNAAVLAEVVGDAARVVSIEMNPAIAATAEDNLRRAGYERARVLAREGGVGDPDHGPYDAIIVTCACTDIPPYWAEQLKMEGTLVLPLATRGMEALVALRKTEADRLEGTFLYHVRFLRMTGAASMITHYHFDSHTLSALKRMIVDGAKQDEGLAGRIRDGISNEERRDFAFYLSIVDGRTISFHDADPEGLGIGYGLWDKRIGEGGFALVFGDKVYTYGKAMVQLDVERHLQRFVALGKPKLKAYRLSVIPRDEAPHMGAYTWCIERASGKTVIDLCPTG